MTYPLSLVMTFAAGAAYECGCVFWVHYSEADATAKAVLWSMVNALVTCIGVEQFLRGPEFVTLYVLGYGFGTFSGSRIKKAGWLSSAPPKESAPRHLSAPPIGATCTHPRMRCPNGTHGCGEPCGHWWCPDCGLSWDDGAEK